MAKTQKRYLVVEDTGNPTWDLENEQPEVFNSYAAAEKRAEKAACERPGETIRIYEEIVTARCEVAAPRFAKAGART